MPKKGLNQSTILQAAVALVEEKGYENFSLRELASRLDVKPSSLYNFVQGIEEINSLVALHAADMLHEVLDKAVNGKDRDTAFLDGTLAYLNFARSNHELYRALIRMPASDDEKIVKAAFASFAPLRDVIRSYGLGEPGTLHFLRSLRSFMHGFVELTGNGFMQRGPATKEETYQLVIQGFLDHLKEGQNHA
ncbi:MAG: TetR/AcrR family transcriptional regulator [Lachnospiraceae bacterium]|nr:TetR/AcrR family transcriptional regulator [Lachnospiraceae bacterium]